MGFTCIMGLLGGLALFLYGMQMMSTGLEVAAGNRMKQILEKLTTNRFLGIGMGALITALIQSSSATTVMVVGFVNSGMMTLKQAVWIIMGANIGTTVTAFLVSLPISEIAMLFSLIGIFMSMLAKKPTIKTLGIALAGLGLIFIGLDSMSAAMEGVKDSDVIKNALASISNPVLLLILGEKWHFWCEFFCGW